MTGLFGIGGNALKYGFETCVHNILRWLALTVVLIIPILNFIGFGILLKVLRNEEPTFENAGKSFVQGLLSFVIGLIYMVIPIVLSCLFGIVGLVLGITLGIILQILLVPATVNFARQQQFSVAFRFSEIFGLIRSVSWGRYILAIIVFLIIWVVIVAIMWILGVIPFIGNVLAVIANIAIYAPVSLFEAKYWNDVFA